MKEYKLFIDGEWVASSSGTILDDINPATGGVYARIHQASDLDLERAIAAAYRAREAWGNTLANQRETIILKAADILELDAPTRELLRWPLREYHFAIPVRMDDGKVRVFRAPAAILR